MGIPTVLASGFVHIGVTEGLLGPQQADYQSIEPERTTSIRRTYLGICDLAGAPSGHTPHTHLQQC